MILAFTIGTPSPHGVEELICEKCLRTETFRRRPDSPCSIFLWYRNASEKCKRGVLLT